MPTFRQMSETVSPLARSRSASRSNRATSSAVLRLLMGPSVSQSTRRLPFRLDQFLGSRPTHPDHRFEWTRQEFRDWAEGVARRHGYAVRFLPVGPVDETLGSPTQMGLFTKKL